MATPPGDAPSQEDPAAHTPAWFDELEDHLIANGWKVAISPGRPTSPWARIEATHRSGAQIVVKARPSSIPGKHKVWRGRNARYYACPAPKNHVRSPWYRLSLREDVLAFAHEPGKHSLEHAGTTTPTPVPEGMRPPRCEHKKVAYSSYEDATTALTETKIRGAFGSARRHEVRVYQCPDDPLVWHLTSQPSRFRKGSR